MAKDTSISIRLDSELKDQSEHILAQFGLSMTSAVNMLLHQIVRDKAIPLALSLNPRTRVNDELLLAQMDRLSGFVGRTSDEVAAEMERVIAEAGNPPQQTSFAGGPGNGR
jgi:DNA-damage-inducible protein J